MNAATTSPAAPQGHAEWLAPFGGQVAEVRQRAALAVNAEWMRLYGRIGSEIPLRQSTQVSTVWRAT